MSYPKAPSCVCGLRQKINTFLNPLWLKRFFENTKSMGLKTWLTEKTHKIHFSISLIVGSPATWKFRFLKYFDEYNRISLQNFITWVLNDCTGHAVEVDQWLIWNNSLTKWDSPLSVIHYSKLGVQSNINLDHLHIWNYPTDSTSEGKLHFVRYGKSSQSAIAIFHHIFPENFSFLALTVSLLACEWRILWPSAQLMKTPERWRALPRRILVSILAP